MQQGGGRKMEGMIRMTSYHYTCACDISWIIHLVKIGKAMTMIVMASIIVRMMMMVTMTMTMTMTMMTSKAE